MATTSMQRAGGGYVQRSGSSGLYEVLDLILDKGLVVDVFVRVSLVGIELLTIDARIVIASVDTYLRFAEAVNRLDLTESGGETLPELTERMSQGGAKSKTQGVIEGAKEKLFGEDGEDEEGASSERGAGSSRGAAKERASSRASQSGDS
ncbi:MAG: gas vesicle structural protein GvpA [Actinomycetota bacterium]|nr:gas vesicle structural protein GvpA [Actinomycetota bacterium]